MATNIREIESTGSLRQHGSNPLKVARIRGINLRVDDVRSSTRFYQTALQMEPLYVGENESFLSWGHDDFLGFFAERVRWRRPYEGVYREGKLWRPHSWHHVELRMEASNYETAIHDMKEKQLVPLSLNSTVSPEIVERDLPGVEIRPSPEGWLLVSTIADPEGRSLEIIYDKAKPPGLERPGILGVELSVESHGDIHAFYQQLGMESFQCSPERCRSQALSEQEWVLEKAEPVGLRGFVLSVTEKILGHAQRYARSLGLSVDEMTHRVESPEGNRLTLVQT